MNSIPVLQGPVSCFQCRCIVVCGLVAAFVGDAVAEDAPVEESSSGEPQLEESHSFFNGSASYRYPISVPAGTAGMAPSISLSYASQSTWSKTGYGWSLAGLDDISRSAKCGVPTLDDRDTFVWRGEELVQDARGIYHTAKESFARIERLSSSWLVTLPSGMKYRYGATENSRVLAHENAEVVHRWALDRVEDPNGNYYTVEYLHDEHSAVYYPQTITYTFNDAAPLAAYRTVHFVWETRPDVRTSYAEGTRQTTTMRLANVESRVDDALHSRHELRYALSAGGKSLLKAISVIGSDNATTLPPTKFDYSQGPQRFGDVISYGDGLGKYISTGGGAKMLIDINGDGLTDEVARSASRRSRVQRPFEIRLGTIEGGFAPVIEWEGVTDSPGVTQTPSHKQALYSTKLMMDMDGDGRPDIIERMPRGREPGNYQVYLNTGAGFAPAADWGPGEARYVMDTHGRANTTKLLMDINGDGLPDELYRRPYQKAIGKSRRHAGQPEVIYNLQVRLNTGSGFGEAQDWGTMQGLYLKEQDRVAHTIHDLVDINGDGLPDDLYRPYARAGGGQPEQISNLLVRLNTGSSFGPVEDWGTMQGQGIRDTARGTSHDLIDINGDGLLDDVYRPRQTARGHKPLDHYLVRLNTGSGFGPTQSWGDGLGGTLHDSHRGAVSHTLMDINGDGLVDDVQRRPGHRRVSSARRNVPYPKDYDVRLNQAGPPALLTMVQLPTGGRIHYEYSVSTQFDNTDYTGTPRLANKIRVVTAITRDDAMGGTSTSRIHYRGGLYEGYPKCEFRGFREVTVTDATGARTLSTYLQDDACWGHSNGSQRFSADNALISATESEWTYREVQAATDGQPEIVFPYVGTTRTKAFDGADTPRIREQHYVYDDYGNVTQITDSGDVTIDGDEVRTTTEYAVNAERWLTNKPSRQIVEDKHAGAWAPARETITYYDGNAHGVITRGNATRVDARVDNDEYITTTAGHDTYGNVVWTRDANANAAAGWPVNRAGHTTDIVFDSAFHTVVTEQRNALDHVTRIEYNALLRPTIATDANGHKTITAYDPHRRPTAVTKPGDAAPTVTTEYVQDGVAPEYTIQRSHTTDGQWLTRYTLVDGFGREIQTKVPDGDGFIATDQFYDALGRQAAVTHGYRTQSIISDDPADRVTEELPLVLLGESFSNVQSNDDGTLSMSGWTRVGEGEAYYGEVGEWTEPSGVNGGMIEFSGADRGDRAVVIGDTDITLGIESEVDLSQWNGRELVFSAQYGAEYTVHGRPTSCRGYGGNRRCYTRSRHASVDKAVMLTVTDADTGSVLLETQLPYAKHERIERGIAAHKLDLAAAAAGTQRIKIRLWVLLPCAGQDISSYAFRVRNVSLHGHKDDLRCILVRDPGQPTTRTEYDALGRVVAQVLPDGTSTTTTYDRGTQTTTNANGVATTHHADAYGRITAIDETLDDGVTTTRYEHRPATGELTQITDAAGNMYTFTYDGLGRKLMEHDTDRGVWHTSYDANGNVIAQRDANQTTTRYHYDAVGRPTKRVTHDDNTTTYAYDDGDNAIGRPSAIETPDIRREFSYDTRGRTIRQRLAVGNHTWTTTLDYDDLDRLTAMTYPDGEIVRTTYDARGFVASLAGDDDYVVGTTYTNYGKLTQLRYGNDTHIDYTYYDDSAVDPISGSAHSYQLRSLVVGGGNIDLSLEYQYDKIGNVIALIDRTNAEHSQYFSYDLADRLVSASGVYGDRSYRYDTVGNIARFDGRTFEYARGNRIRYDGLWTYEHDDNGNVIARTRSGTTQRFAFDSQNRMTGFQGDTVERYIYGEGETRIAKTADDKTTYYVNNDYEEVWRDGERIEVIKHYRSGQQKVATRDEDGLKYIYADHLGSSSRMANAAGKQVKAIWYMPFGGNAKEHGNAKARYRYTGKEKDDTGLYYYGARYYDDALGRFLAADSILPDVYDPQQLNRFAYVRNNPIKMVDPDGHFAVLGLLVSGAVSGAIAAATDWGIQVAANLAATSEPHTADTLYQAMVTDVHWEEVAVSASIGFASGMLLGPVVSRAMSTIVGRGPKGIRFIKGSKIDATNWKLRTADKEFPYDVSGHGTPDSFSLYGVLPTSAKDLAAYMRYQGWKGENVRLLACDVGKCNYAQQLADELGVAVKAGTGRVGATPTGRHYVENGQFKVFEPGGNTYTTGAYTSDGSGHLVTGGVSGATTGVVRHHQTSPSSGSGNPNAQTSNRKATRYTRNKKSNNDD